MEYGRLAEGTLMVKFGQLQYFWIFGLILVMIGIQLYYNRRRRKGLEQFADRQLLSKLMDGYRPRVQRSKQLLFIGALVFLGIALIGPKVGKKLIEVKRRGIDIILAFDTSLSMNAEDVKPNRLLRAKYETGKFINQLRGDRIGLVAFAGISYLQCPLTLDYSAAKLFLDIIDTGIIGTQGTAFADAIQTALNAFKVKEKKHKVIVLISDGEDQEGNLKETIQRVRDEGVVIYTVGVGSVTGAPIPIANPQSGSLEFKRDRSGHVVTTALEEDVLRDIATQSGGKYYNLRNNGDVFTKIYNEIIKLEQKDIRSHEYSDYQDRYQIFLLIAIVLVTLELSLTDKGKAVKAPSEK